jgi:hypothetical protein
LSDPLVDELLAKPVGPTIPARTTDPDKDFTRQIEVTGDVAAVTVRGPVGEADESAAYAFLRARGEDPGNWVVTGFRGSEWTMASGEPGVSNRFSFARVGSPEAERPPIDEILRGIKRQRPKLVRPDGDHGFIVALGDMQFGKIDGDGPEGTLKRTIDCIDKAAASLEWYRKRFDIGHVHVAWMGDHIEGFVSQGGANTWRTQLTLNEQIRLTRRAMQHALQTFAPLADRVTMAAVPGNHGEAVRFSGKGITRYDDSHDTESLIAVHDAVRLWQAASDQPTAFDHVEFFVPDTDELTVVLDVANTVVAHNHGHPWRPGKHFEWWQGQAFNKASAMHQADLLLAGHLHHEFVDTEGARTFIQPPAMESESTWFRHNKGTTGAPGLIVAVTKDGAVPVKELIR